MAKLFTALEKHQIDIAAANLRYQPKKLEKFQIGPKLIFNFWQLVYRKGEIRPYLFGTIERGASYC